LLERSGPLAKALNEHGLGKGDVVSIYLPNTPQYMTSIVGALQAGCANSGGFHGGLYVVDRAKDMSIVGGYKVFSSEVEDKLYKRSLRV